MVSIFSKTPAEHAAISRRQRAIAMARARKGKGKETDPYTDVCAFEVPDGHARVKFYSHLRRATNGARPDMDDLFKLDPNGSLDIIEIVKRWNLDNAVPVCPTSGTALPCDDGKISPIAVKVLGSSKGAIKIIELHVSKSTQIKRAIRNVLITALYTIFTLIEIQIRNFIDYLSTLPPVVAVNHTINHPATRWIGKGLNKGFDLIVFLSTCLIIFTAGLIVIMLSALAVQYYQINEGNVLPAVAVQERFRKWAMTGSIAL